MTNEEAIRILEGYIYLNKHVPEERYLDSNMVEACEVAVEALKVIDGGIGHCLDKFTKEYAKQMKERLSRVNWEEMSEQEKIEWIREGKGLPKI